MKKFTVLMFFFFGLSTTAFAQKAIGEKNIVYKQIDTTSLSLIFYYPDNFDTTKIYPAIIFFFGGGWIEGNVKQFEPQAKYFAKRGMIAVLADYRVNKRHGTSPFEAVKDAKSAIRFLRKDAKNLNIDINRIVASGGSAGGHLAAACGNIKGFEEEGEDLSISSKPNALVLFNPAIDNGPGGYGYNRIGERYHEFSPIHNIHENAPPTIVFLGTNDKFIPVETVKYYKVIMDKVGSRCELHLYEGQKHGFINYHKNIEFYKKTLFEADQFLTSLGYLKDKSIIND
jgi:acetyl esterase/lipase